MIKIFITFNNSYICNGTAGYNITLSLLLVLLLSKYSVVKFTTSLALQTAHRWSCSVGQLMVKKINLV